MLTERITQAVDNNNARWGDTVARAHSWPGEFHAEIMRRARISSTLSRADSSRLGRCASGATPLRSEFKILQQWQMIWAN